MTYEPPDPARPAPRTPDVEIPPHSEPTGEPPMPEYEPEMEPERPAPPEEPWEPEEGTVSSTPVRRPARLPRDGVMVGIGRSTR